MFGLGIALKEIFLSYSTQFVFSIVRLVPGNVVMAAINTCGKSPIMGEWIYGITWNHVYFNIPVFYCRYYFYFQTSVSYCLLIDWLIDLFIYLFIHLFINLFFFFIYLFIYLFIIFSATLTCYSHFCCHCCYHCCCFCCWNHRCLLCVFGYCCC